ncbi:MAG: squalene synthase HpnD [Paracoccaceae bacterium]|jgi:squalene synthase HpnD
MVSPNTAGNPASDPDAAAREHVRAVTRAAGSSFYWGMRILPEDRRDAMFAIYAFCREVDDIADGTDPVEEKRLQLDAWRREIEALYAPDQVGSDSHVLRALARSIRMYNLEKKDFFEVIAGMEMDTDETIVAPDCKQLELYCNRVAGAVGLLSVHVFGDSSATAQQFAITLGTALQLTNILRDLKDDAAMGRLYLPREQLDAHGVAIGTPDEILASPKLPEICASVAERAREKYAAADRLLAQSDARALKPAVVMMMNYRRILDRMIANGWRDLDDDAGLSTPEKLWITLRYGVL